MLGPIQKRSFAIEFFYCFQVFYCFQGRLERCIGGHEIIQETAEDVAKPSTIILSCSDSRAPPEIVCDMGLGDCHVVR